ncbi:unnamed protein product [Paramecium sonneborni]|uniref:Protein-tyrosine-phosphatase n=1 Tax=Paramecium sonneborni TaxID=65129 RepID=A0A8S1N3Q3_9CILI|nr:unnamed protein product [Paramecium sonneborni]
MQVSTLLEQIPESISLILEPTLTQGALYLGNLTSLYKAAQKNQIKVAVSICDQIDTKDIELEQHLCIDLTDKEDSDIQKYFNQTNMFIQENLNKGNVLVHCFVGISRSATIVIAYIMWSQRITFQQAFLLVTSKRSQVYPNKGFRQQLIKYQQELQQIQRQ